MLGWDLCCWCFPRAGQDLDGAFVLVSLNCYPVGRGLRSSSSVGFRGSCLARQKWGSPLLTWLSPTGPAVESSGLRSKAVTAPAPSCLWTSDHGPVAGGCGSLPVGAQLCWECSRGPSPVHCWCWPRSSRLLVPRPLQWCSGWLRCWRFGSVLAVCNGSLLT